ncbi:MAG: hypothetical protein PHE49_08465 [bacterium]|nr:hypothetical protein [bacterium]
MNRKESNYNKVGLLFLQVLILCMAGCAPFYNQPEFLIRDIDKGLNEKTKFQFLMQSTTGMYWALFTSYEYGYYDYWLACSKDKKQWEKTFTGLRMTYEEKIEFNIYSGNLIIKALSPKPLPHKYYELIDSVVKSKSLNETAWKQVGPALDSLYKKYRVIEKYWFDIWSENNLYDMKNRGKFVIPIDSLLVDSDNDGLTDITERRLLTNLQDTDTDHDGIKDNLDRNPLVKQPDTLSERHKLIKLVIENYLRKFNIKRTIIVEVPSDMDKLEFENYKGIILCLTTDEGEEFQRVFGYSSHFDYGITFLSARLLTINDSKAEVVFSSYRGPLNAFGYTVVCKRKKDGTWGIDFLKNEWLS